MTTKHTPGPWSYAADDKLNPERAFGIVRPLGARFDAEAGTEGATEVIAEICGDDGSGTAEADARLIAAAPDMLDVLRNVQSALDDLAHGWPHDELHMPLPELREAIQDAIAKATKP